MAFGSRDSRSLTRRTTGADARSETPPRIELAAHRLKPFPVGIELRQLAARRGCAACPSAAGRRDGGRSVRRRRRTPACGRSAPWWIEIATVARPCAGLIKMSSAACVRYSIGQATSGCLRCIRSRTFEKALHALLGRHRVLHLVEAILADRRKDPPAIVDALALGACQARGFAGRRLRVGRSLRPIRRVERLGERADHRPDTRRTRSGD